MELPRSHNISTANLQPPGKRPALMHRSSTSVSETIKLASRSSTSASELVQPASRSSTNPSSTTAEDRSERSNLSRRLHASSLRSKALPGGLHHKHKHHHSIRHSAKNTVQDLKPTTTLDSILRRDRKSPDSSRRQSASQPQQQWDFAQQQAEAERRRVKPEDVEALREKNEQREVELRVALAKVEQLGMQSTRQLDDTYYSILEKAEMLRNTVAQMQNLADESRETREKYDKDAESLEKEVSATLDGFEDFKQREENVDALVKRLAEAKAKTEALNERLEGARKRVETYETKYRETRAKRRKQWNITWGTLLAGIVVMVALLIARNHNRIDIQLNEIGRPLAELVDAVDEAARPITTRLRPSPSEDPVLDHMFDKVMEV